MISLSLILSFAWATRTALASGDGDASLDALVKQLQDERSSDEAANELIKRGQADPETRKYVGGLLPALLRTYKPKADGEINWVWGSEAKVAGELKMTEAVPALCRRIDMITRPKSGGSLGYNFMEREAVRSLILIGQPAVAAVIYVLRHGTPLQREEAAYILGEIGTDPARQALTDVLQSEGDRAVRDRVEEALKRPRRSSTSNTATL